MIIRIDGDGAVRLLEADNLRGFSIAMPDTAAARAALAGLGRLDGPGHAWVPADRVRALAQPTPPGWEDGFTAMVAYAAGKGWTDDTGALRAHIDYG